MDLIYDARDVAITRILKVGLKVPESLRIEASAARRCPRCRWQPMTVVKWAGSLKFSTVWFQSPPESTEDEANATQIQIAHRRLVSNEKRSSLRSLKLNTRKIPPRAADVAPVINLTVSTHLRNPPQKASLAHKSHCHAKQR